jgi:hypothetical protein
MIPRIVDRRVQSVVGAQANGEPVRVDGKQTSVVVETPAALGLIEGSDDLRNWVGATDRLDGTTALATLTDGTHNGIFERFVWLRPAVADDAGGPRAFDFRFVVQDEPDP